MFRLSCVGCVRKFVNCVYVLVGEVGSRAGKVWLRGSVRLCVKWLLACVRVCVL